MLSPIKSHIPLLCHRRDFLRVGGGLAVASLVLPKQLLATTRIPPAAGRGNASSCILVYLLGGPPHLDTFDLKPDAPSEIRGPFRPISTRVPGMQICEHLPRLAACAPKLALVRSVSHPNSNHTPMIYYTLTGRPTEQPSMDNDVRAPLRTDFPHTGAVVARFKGANEAVPGFVAIPEVAVRSSLSGEFKRARLLLRGGGSGFLGARHDPLAVDGEPGTREAVPALALPGDVSLERFETRRQILSLLDSRGSSDASAADYHAVRQRAFWLTGAANGTQSRAFSLEGETVACRDRYGRNRFGQALLLARRLTEAGVPFVGVHFNEMTVCDGWDTHQKNFDALKDELLPILDQGLSALIEDLDQRGRLGETLIVCMGEFGRTPKINSNAGRDHWGDCSTTLLAGGGIRGGQIYGESDRIGSFPKSDGVDPVDIQATLYHALALDPASVMHDHLNRPFPLSEGRVLHRLF
ncbi:MAG TPA: DUF1501 domain-containing protein [Planctomycetota bacterium]|nr:DUF1501 domain-containing protein [Planctomycetota bacterium]